MKIVLFCPHLTEGHALIASLEARGYHVLRGETAEEARWVAELHRHALSAVVIHRESTPTSHDSSGVEVIRSLRSIFPEDQSTRLIVISHDWSEADFNAQSKLAGVIFLKWPLDSEVLVTAIDTGSSPSFSPQSSQVESTQLVASPHQQSSLTGSIQLDTDHLSLDLDLDLGQVPTAASISIELTEDQPAIETFSSLPTIDLTLQEEAIEPETLIEPETDGLDSPVLDELPYLHKNATWNPAASFAQPLEDAVVPGGAAHAPDLETLKKYLLLREQDVAALSSQLRAARSQVAELEKTARLEKGRNHDFLHSEKQLKDQLSGLDDKHQEAVKLLQSEVAQLKFTLKTRSDKAKLLESEMKKVSDDMESLKDRVRYDIRRIQVNEKELANRIEIIKKDSEILLSSREVKIIELKRKVDLLEFNMDLLQSQYSKEREKSKQLQERLDRAAQMVKVAGGFLDKPGVTATDSDAA